MVFCVCLQHTICTSTRGPKSLKLYSLGGINDGNIKEYGRPVESLSPSFVLFQFNSNRQGIPEKWEKWDKKGKYAFKVAPGFEEKNELLASEYQDRWEQCKKTSEIKD